MVRRKEKSEDEKSISEMADEVIRETVRGMYKDGKLTSQGRSLAKLMDRIMPDEKVDEWGWNLSRKERAAIKRRVAEKKAAEEKKKAEARARAAYRRRQRKLEENGLLEGFVQINWSFMAARDELKRRGFRWGAEGMGESLAPVQTPRTVALPIARKSVVKSAGKRGVKIRKIGGRKGDRWEIVNGGKA